MSNVLGAYNPTFFAQEALMLLWEEFGVGRSCYLGYDEERRTFNKGDTVRIRKPGKFTTQAGGTGTAQDVATSYLDITVDTHREVNFALSDKELAYTQDRIIDEHIRPATMAIVEYVEDYLEELSLEIPWFVDLASTPDYKDIVNARTQLRDQLVPVRDRANMFMRCGTALEGALLKDPVFIQSNTDANGGSTQRDGVLGNRLGFNFYSPTTVRSHTKGTLNDTGPLLKGAHAAGATSITLDAGTLTGTLTRGDTLVLAGNTQRYAVTALATAASNEITVSITPALVVAYADNAAATVRLDNHVVNLAHHRNAFALVTAKLPDVNPSHGAAVTSVQDPETGLALRSRMWYEGKEGKHYVSLDILFGGKTLDPNLATRVCG